MNMNVTSVLCYGVVAHLEIAGGNGLQVWRVVY